MPRNFYILRDDRNWWGISDQPFLGETGTSYRTHSEAMDHLRNQLAGKGLVMGRSFPEDFGFRIEAMDPAAPMLFSAGAINVANSLKDTFGRKLKSRALDLARLDGRRTVTHDDILAALDGLDVLSLEPGSDEEPGDGK